MCLQNAPKSKKRNQSIFRAFLLTNLLKGIKLRKELKDFIEASNIHGKLQIFFASKFSKNNDFRNKIFDFFSQIFGPDEVTDTKTNNELAILKKVIALEGQMMISLQFVGEHQNEASDKSESIKESIAMALFSLLPQGKKTHQCAVIDYIATLSDLPYNIKEDFGFTLSNNKLRGKGISRLLLFFIKKITYYKMNEVSANIRIKCPENLITWYKACGFVEDTFDYQKNESLKLHMESVCVHPSLLPFIHNEKNDIALNYVNFNQKLELKEDNIAFSFDPKKKVDSNDIENMFLRFF